MTTDQFGMTDGDYVPDPESDTETLVAGFFDHISATSLEQALPGDLVSAMRERHAELEAGNAHMVVDEPSRHNLRITLAVVAAYEKLLPRLGGDAATRAVRAALLEPLGEACTFQRSADNDQRDLLDVQRCFYHDVLRANSASELTPVMCAFDRNWIEAIDPDRHGFRFERATTIGLGGDRCPFHFTRTAP
ncbi:L-2-amino-thiazoline-4-carboxylic acid hydrolase [Streptomyces sp. ME19-01-6]|uniref:L-2-amino-thiazoline-4-carboxylic acid hydrolase n=1 Tax=Streptomyces sp. ME19-01-6 TaxID=3028686 RepID=UPI0029A5C801|nr:L-2-amino-thiazoline-4-carboxylic acid hydrolase [Streptomyces sp. ME19-01-6]MDX3233671.1 L-2-amino-thiazoline-4-carboxylic acid hydrolase [Streptomyces sp. ME19-01-6]